MTDAELTALLLRAVDALDTEAAWLVDVDIDDRGRQRPSIPARDREFFDALNEQAEELRALAELIRARRAR